MFPSCFSLSAFLSLVRDSLFIVVLENTVRHSSSSYSVIKSVVYAAARICLFMLRKCRLSYLFLPLSPAKKLVHLSHGLCGLLGVLGGLKTFQQPVHLKRRIKKSLCLFSAIPQKSMINLIFFFQSLRLVMVRRGWLIIILLLLVGRHSAAPLTPKVSTELRAFYRFKKCRAFAGLLRYRLNRFFHAPLSTFSRECKSRNKAKSTSNLLHISLQ